MSKPNIIFILLDDMGWRDLGCYGSGFYETPNIDRLAAEGLLFTDAYASCPVCSPTRASVMTGKYPATVNITNYIPGAGAGKLLSTPYLHALPREEVSIAQALKDGGYQTWHVGKWHLGEDNCPTEFGFDVNLGGCGWGHPRKGYWAPWQFPAPGNIDEGVPDGTYLTDHLTDRAIDLMRHAGDAPFFLNFCHYAVHTPIQSPPDLVAKYEQKARDMGLDKQQAIVRCEPFPCLHKKNEHVERRIIQSDAQYAAMIENLDTNIGKLLDALDELGMADNTAVFFTSDNGGLSTAESSPTCNFPLSEGKGWMYEGGTREPLLVRWPGQVKAGTTTKAITTTPDFYPTFLEMAGLPLRPDQHVDGKSILPVLKGDASFDRGPIFWHYPHYGNQGGTPGCSVRRGDWKLIEFFEDERLELYNLADDIGETHNRVNEQPELAEELYELLVEWRESAGAKVPEVNPHYMAHLRDELPAPPGA